MHPEAKKNLPLQMTSGQCRLYYVVQENFRSDIPFLLLPSDSCIEIAQAWLHHNRNSLSSLKKTDIHNNDKKAQKILVLALCQQLLNMKS